ncbi:MAG: hypothetical protein KKC79_01595 [Gammaproteobacteria bacterium]|nr:hypothetical protein [Gammaproteobacteria bacterium]MBU1441562.1 hypothetical protein [Gammaproteobacteria bacterium]MBU2288954.1 hypothetical protein [Gammaproteobacteria bacterium]MBU2407324.1 hypothetical protein [Gammaproteobacteria bacterium]
MTSPLARPSFSFHIEDGAPTTHAVSVTVLVQILQSAQQAFELIGMQVEGRSVKQRARVPAKTSERFQLVCQIPQEGSYQLPVVIGNTAEMFHVEEAEEALRIFRQLMELVSTRSLAGWSDVLPDERIRRRVFEAVKGMAPSAGAKWSVQLQDSGNRVFATLDQNTIRFVQELLVPIEQREASRVVTGELKTIDFFERSLTIIYPPTSKELVCIYDEEVEELLIERRRDLIQVTGRVLLDDAGQPKKLIDVSDIRVLDLSPFELPTILTGDVHLRSKHPLTLEVFSDETKQLMCVEDDRLNILAFGATREALQIELAEQIAMLWREYALAPVDSLDASAIALKQALQAQFAEVGNAA